jgi:hypothetical protein
MLGCHIKSSQAPSFHFAPSLRMGTSRPVYFVPGVEQPFTAITIAGPSGYVKSIIIEHRHGDSRAAVVGAFAAAAIEALARALEEHAGGAQDPVERVLAAHAEKDGKRSAGGGTPPPSKL